MAESSRSKGAPTGPAEPLLKTEQEDVPASKRSVRDLYDFTEEFVKNGYASEYAKFRDGYLKWRQGDHKGAKGEHDHKTLVKNAKFQKWYPTVRTFTFRRTVTYWISVLFVEGCLFFLWPPLFLHCWPNANERMTYYLAKVPLLLGTTIFGLGIYMGYLELINMDADKLAGKDGASERINYLWCDWRELVKLLSEKEADDSAVAEKEAEDGSREPDVEEVGEPEPDDEEDKGEDHAVYWYQPWSSIVGWVVYLIGAMCYQTANTSDMFDLAEETRISMVEWPLVLGGFCFFSGGVCEIVHNRVWITDRMRLVWWSSIVNFIGGFDFWISACPSLVGDYATIIGAKGTVLYLFGAILSLCMWRGEQFGLTLISNLNRVQRISGTQVSVATDAVSQKRTIVHEMIDDIDKEVEQKLSWRGLLFIFLCVLCGTSQLLNVCEVIAAPWEFKFSERTAWRRLAIECISGSVHVLGVHLLILLNSVCVTVPRKQPYRLLAQLMRFSVLMLTIQSLIRNQIILEDEYGKKFQ